MSLKREVMMRCSARRAVLGVSLLVAARLVWVTVFDNNEPSRKSGQNTVVETGGDSLFAKFFGAHHSLEIQDSGAGLEARNASFYLDGKPLRIISGSFHYFRTRPQQWEDRLQRMKAACLNTVTTYIPWNLHERHRGVYDFASDGYDLEQFIKLVHKMKLHLIIRPGPYICAEWEFGGLPSWLLHDPGMALRTSKYSPYLKHVERYFSHLLPLLARFTHQRGGPIIAFQIENEFGSHKSSPDRRYLQLLVEMYRLHGINELLFTSDGAKHFNAGTLPKIFATVNFNRNPEDNLQSLLLFQPGRPLMVAEFWPGWFDHWGESHHTMTVAVFKGNVGFILSHNASINFYMFTGGTNFGFWNGANHKDQYEPTVTSYDYDALISECGDVHPTKFRAFREILQKNGLVPLAELPVIPPNPPKQAYGVVTFEQTMTLSSLTHLVGHGMSFNDPIFMEFLSINQNSGQCYGWILYRAEFRGSTLTLSGKLHDRAQIFVNGKLIKTVYNRKSDDVNIGVDVELSSDKNVVEILVENMGRVNYGDALDLQRKGFQGRVLSGKEKISEWDHIPLEFDANFTAALQVSSEWKSAIQVQSVPTIYRGWLKIEDKPNDTFVDMSGWTKGIVIINGFNIGRYWNIGPQQTLYVPWPLLKRGRNEVMIFELEKPGFQVKFVDRPRLGD